MYEVGKTCDMLTHSKYGNTLSSQHRALGYLFSVLLVKLPHIVPLSYAGWITFLLYYDVKDDFLQHKIHPIKTNFIFGIFIINLQ